MHGNVHIWNLWLLGDIDRRREYKPYFAHTLPPPPLSPSDVLCMPSVLLSCQLGLTLIISFKETFMSQCESKGSRVVWLHCGGWGSVGVGGSRDGWGSANPDNPYPSGTPTMDYLATREEEMHPDPGASGRCGEGAGVGRGGGGGVIDFIL